MTDKYKNTIKIENHHDSFEWTRRLTTEEFNKISLEIDKLLREYPRD